ncbi:hypothetical protein [Pontibacter roseus]|uniref:hypothetical protein n=1 Tax=Pontibacter roseus TaxID=336989 RepID=UPI00037A7066|nr:hypothetical protein [Pontibacter roseus]
MKKLPILLALSALSFMGCSKDEEPAAPENWVNNTGRLYEQNSNKVTVDQGISGTLTLTEGNCMPIIDYTKCKEYPVKRKIMVYPYTTIQQASSREDFVYYTLATAPLATVESDATGFYEVRLAPGTYSVLIQEQGKLYANGSDGHGGINPVEVKSKEVSQLNLRLDFATH